MQRALIRGGCLAACTQPAVRPARARDKNAPLQTRTLPSSGVPGVSCWSVFVCKWGGLYPRALGGPRRRARGRATNKLETCQVEPTFIPRAHKVQSTPSKDQRTGQS